MKTTVFATLLCVLLPLALAEAPYSPQETYGAPEAEQSFSSASGSALPPSDAPQPPRIVYVLNHIPHISVIQKPAAHYEAPLVHHHAGAAHAVVHHDLHHAGHVAHHPVPYVYGHNPGDHHAVPVVHDVHQAVPIVHDDHHSEVIHSVPGAHNGFPVIYFSAPDAHDHHEVHHAVPVVHHDSPVEHHSAPLVHH